VNVLFLSHRLPYAPNRGDRVRAFHLLRELSRWAQVDIVALAHDAEEASHADDLKSVARSVVAARVPKALNLARAAFALPSRRPTTHSLLASPEFDRAVDAVATARRPDVVLAYCTGIAPAAFRPSLQNAPVVLDMVDVDSQKWASLSVSSAPPRSWVYARESRVLAAFEAEASRRSAATLVVNDKERAALASIAPGAKIHAIENGVDLAALRPSSPPAAEPVVVFCGVMNYVPNVEGAVWLAREVWPVVRASRPDARLEIVGAHPTGAVQALDNSSAGIHVRGSVPDVRPHLWAAAVSAAPLHTARGIQNKVLEAVAAGLPVVVTPAVMEGLPPEVRPACVEASTADGFAARLVEWLQLSAAKRRAIASSAALDELSWDRRLAGLRSLMESAADRR
jgi:sugar transferase (PEP-CTERM/EpsH1 system associated)